MRSLELKRKNTGRFAVCSSKVNSLGCRMIIHANHGYFRKRKSLACGADCISSVAAVVESSGEEAWMATAPPDTATTSFSVAVRYGEEPERLPSAALCSDEPGRNSENGCRAASP